MDVVMHVCGFVWPIKTFDNPYTSRQSGNAGLVWTGWQGRRCGPGLSTTPGLQSTRVRSVPVQAGIQWTFNCGHHTTRDGWGR